MSKWKVKKFCDDFFSPDHTEWVAWPEGGWTECRGFPTHAEALAYADKQARTMEITLPRKPGITKIGRRKHAIVTTTKNGGTALYIMDDAGDDHVTFMKTKYLEPLALALLAHAERMEA